MKKALIKDILITATIFITDIIFMPLGIFLPFFYSYLKQSDLSITFSFIYTLTIYMFIGNIFSSFIMPKFFFILGIKKTFMFGGLCSFCLYILGIFTNKYLFYLFSIFCGICVNLKSLPTNYLLSVKYENGVDYLAYSYAGQSFGVLLWAYLMNRIVNPENESMSISTHVNGFTEFYYSESVNKNFVVFLLVNSFISLFVIIGVSCFIEEPKNKNGNLILWLKVMIFRDKKSVDCLKLKKKNFDSDFKNLANQSNISQPIIVIKSKSMIEKKLQSFEKTLELLETSQKSTTSLEQEIKATIYSKKFLGFIILTFLKNTSSAVFINCTKIIGNEILNNDKLLSYIFAMTCLADIFGRFLVTYTWNKFGFYKTYILNFCFTIFGNLLFVFWTYSSQTGFIVNLFLISLCWAFNYLLGHCTIFGLYSPDKAVGLVKAFDFYFVFYAVYGAQMVRIFISCGNYRLCFFTFAVFECLALFFFVKYYKDFGDK